MPQIQTFPRIESPGTTGETIAIKNYVTDWQHWTGISQSDLLQDYWKELEGQLIAVIDDLVPIVKFSYRETKNEKLRTIKHKMNERKRLKDAKNLPVIQTIKS